MGPPVLSALGWRAGREWGARYADISLAVLACEGEGQGEKGRRGSVRRQREKQRRRGGGFQSPERLTRNRAARLSPGVAHPNRRREGVGDTPAARNARLGPWIKVVISCDFAGGSVRGKENYTSMKASPGALTFRKLPSRRGIR